MKDAIFKRYWERQLKHVGLDIDTAQRLLSPYSLEPIANVQLLSDGCANTNYKISFKSDSVAGVVLRLYAREKSALMREIALYRLLAKKLPISTRPNLNHDVLALIEHTINSYHHN